MVCVSSVARSCPTLCDPMDPTRLLCPWNFPGKNTGVGCHFHHQGIFRPRDQTSASYVSCIGRWVLYHYCHLGSPLSHGDLVKRQLYNSGARGGAEKSLSARLPGEADAAETQMLSSKVTEFGVGPSSFNVPSPLCEPHLECSVMPISVTVIWILG